MGVLALASIRSCAVTTAATALAATWPKDRPCLLAELDPAGGTVAAAAGWSPEPGLVSLATAARRSSDPGLVLAHCQTLGGVVPVLSGPVSAGQARSALGMLGGFLARLGDLDGDVVADCGRLDTGSPNTDVVGQAELALLVTRPRLADLHALSSWLEGPGRAFDRLGLLLVGPGPYPAGEVEEALGVEVLGHLPWDPPAAEGLATMSVRSPQLTRAPLVRAARSLADQLAGHLADRPDGAQSPDVEAPERLAKADAAASPRRSTAEVGR